MTGQNAVMLAALKQGPRTASELNRMGIGRPNSRAAHLRKRGHQIVCTFNANAEGAARYVYRLLDEAGTATAASGGTLVGPVSSSSPRKGVSPAVEPSLLGVPAGGGCSSCLGGSTGDSGREGRVQGVIPARLIVSPADGRVEPETPEGQLSLLAVVA